MSDGCKVIDMHAHIGGPGDERPDDLWWSEQFEDGIGFKALKVFKGWSCQPVGDKLVRETLLKDVDRADNVDYAVALAFDSVYEPNGDYRGPKLADPADVRSTFYVSNRYVVDLAKSNPKILAGISVHPFREDAVDELDLFKDEKRVVLCKLMPSAHLIDFEDSKGKTKLTRFYQRLSEINLPLLLHTGVETTIPTVDPKYEDYNNGKYMEEALDLGVTVILAHCSCSYFDVLQRNMVDDAVKMFKRLANDRPNWRLYADISALFSPFRALPILDRVLGGQEIPRDRLVYGSDFPNPTKGRKESILRPFLRLSKTNLIRRSAKVARKWLRQYCEDGEARFIMTNFHRVLKSLGRGEFGQAS
jgi:predicted TIM-barrel fold metal-dependent hydrolase